MYSHSWRSLSELRGVFRTQSSIWGRKFLICLWGSIQYMCYQNFSMTIKIFFRGMPFLVHIWAEEQQLYKTELLYLYLLKNFKYFQYLPLIYCQNPKWNSKSIYFRRAFPNGCFQHISFKVLKQNCSHYDYIR